MLLLTEGQVCDYKGVVVLKDALPAARSLIADKGYDANWFWHALTERGITSCIPPKSNRKSNISCDRVLYR